MNISGDAWHSLRDISELREPRQPDLEKDDTCQQPLRVYVRVMYVSYLLEKIKHHSLSHIIFVVCLDPFLQHEAYLIIKFILRFDSLFFNMKLSIKTEV